MKSVLICAIGINLWIPACLHAQDANAGGLEITTLEGTLEAVAGDRVKIKSEDGTEYFAVLSRDSKLKYSGTAEAKFLRPGLMVRFVAAFDLQKGIAIKPVGEIEVFRASQKRRMSPEERQKQTPGVYPYQGEDKETPKNARQAAQRVASNQEFQIVGQLRVIQSKKMQVLAGSRPIIVDLNDDTKISVTAGDILFCMPGDNVKLTGLRNPQQPTWVQAETIEIEGAKPLGTVGEKAGSSTKQAKRRGKLGSKDK